MTLSTTSPKQNDDTKKTSSVTFYFRTLCSLATLSELTVYLASSKTETDDEGNIINDHADITVTLKCSYYDEDGTSCTYTTTETVNEPSNYSFSLSGLKTSALNGSSKMQITFAISGSYMYTYADTISSALSRQGMTTIAGNTYPYAELDYTYTTEYSQSDGINEGYPYIYGFYESSSEETPKIWYIDEKKEINEGYPYIQWTESSEYEAGCWYYAAESGYIKVQPYMNGKILQTVVPK